MLTDVSSGLMLEQLRMQEKLWLNYELSESDAETSFLHLQLYAVLKIGQYPKPLASCKQSLYLQV
jgi:hypothetical protein